ncbi:insulinase family protein [Sporosarcina sp. BI001-red]|uniref:EF-P 5-aminopentanol modification-associated protein YfmH n=1 Tax=Sporosarcina sp. BI001-red TaxID=2282866 RepID=UPI000E263C44|nr:pitrilysin family protein [Sporosarcina sp. BI001-red]REB07415.1 insulinase family protein [Sporosarcina sp. BI001-red]
MEKLDFTTIDEVVYTEQLLNGLNVILIPKKTLSKTFGIFTADFGGADLEFIPYNETEAVQIPSGTAHYLEHKLFDKGDHDVYAEFGKLGSDVNAYTNDSETSYYFTTVGNEVENVELLLNFVQDPFLTDETVNKEKGIISQEYQMYADIPEQRIYLAVQESLFAKHPVRNEVLGTLESINNMTKEQLLTAYETFYHPTNMTLAISGNFDTEEMMTAIRNNQELKKFPEIGPFTRVYPNEQKEVHESQRTQHMNVSVPKVMIGIKEYVGQIPAKELGIRKLLTSMTLDYFYSRSGKFYQELADSELIDSSFMFTSVIDKTFGFSMIGSNSAHPEQLADQIKTQLKSLATAEIEEQQFERLKKRTIGKTLRRMNSIENNAQGMIWYRNRALSYFEIIPSIQQLTLSDWKSFLSSWIEEERLTVCNIMPE